MRVKVPALRGLFALCLLVATSLPGAAALAASATPETEGNDVAFSLPEPKADPETAESLRRFTDKEGRISLLVPSDAVEQPIRDREGRQRGFLVMSQGYVENEVAIVTITQVQLMRSSFTEPELRKAFERGFVQSIEKIATIKSKEWTTFQGVPAFEAVVAEKGVEQRVILFEKGERLYSISVTGPKTFEDAVWKSVVVE